MKTSVSMVLLLIGGGTFCLSRSFLIENVEHIFPGEDRDIVEQLRVGYQ